MPLKHQGVVVSEAAYSPFSDFCKRLLRKDERMRVVLVDPAPRRGIREAYESLGIAYIAATLRAGSHEVTLISSALRCLSVRAMVRAIRKVGVALSHVLCSEAVHMRKVPDWSIRR